jgi:hypothetical protein
MFQLPFAGIMMSDGKDANLKIPMHLKHVWISHSLFGVPVEDDLVLHGVVQYNDMFHDLDGQYLIYGFLAICASAFAWGSDSSAGGYLILF